MHRVVAGLGKQALGGKLGQVGQHLQLGCGSYQLFAVQCPALTVKFRFLTLQRGKVLGVLGKAGFFVGSDAFAPVGAGVGKNGAGLFHGGS